MMEEELAHITSIEGTHILRPIVQFRVRPRYYDSCILVMMMQPGKRRK